MTQLGDTAPPLLVCKRICCVKDHPVDHKDPQELADRKADSVNNSDTGYETISRYESLTRKSDALDADFTIETVVDTTNSYSQCDLTAVSAKPVAQKQHEHFNERRTQLIGQLIEMEANFVSYLSVAVATFTRPLRGFFLKQQDYFNLFQNVEKILIISENFLRSMDKWSAYDLYTRIGQFYTQKLSLFRDAFTIYVKGYAASKSLLGELKAHSKQFRLFLQEVQSEDLTLANLLDLPVVHMQQTLAIFKQIRRFTAESKSETPHIDSVVGELKQILASQEPVVSYTRSVDNSTVESTTFFMSESTIFSSCSIDLSANTSCNNAASSQNSDCTLCSTGADTSSDSSEHADNNSDSILNIRY